jgi:hypothetical protein
MHLKGVRGVTSTGRLTGSWEWNHTIMFHIRRSAAPKFFFFWANLFVRFMWCHTSSSYPFKKWGKFASRVNHIWASFLNGEGVPASQG